MSEYRNSAETADKLKKWHVLALGIIVLMLVLSHGIVQYAMRSNEDDARVINLAGRQRMLSQRISKAILGLYYRTDEKDFLRYHNELDIAVMQFKESHNGLINGDEKLGLPGKNSAQIVKMYRKIEPRFNAVVGAADEVRRVVSGKGYTKEELVAPIQIIKDNESEYNNGMDAIVYQYDHESKQKIRRILLLGMAALAISLAILWLEVVYIYKPALRYVRNAMEKVEAGKELLDTTMKSIGVAVLVTDPLGRITLLNYTAERYTGWTEAEALGRDINDVFNNINVMTGKKEVDPVRYVLETGADIETPKYEGLISRNGTEIRISGYASGIHSENGEISGVVISVRDISKEYEMESEMAAFLDVNIDMLCVTDSDGIFIKVNRKFEDILGYKAEELRGKNIMTFIHEEDIPATRAAMGELLEKKSISGFTNRYRCKDGSYKYFEWYSQPGIGKYTYSSARDVTEKILAEEKLREIAVRDELTGLYNRHYFDSIIDDEIDRSDRYDEPLSMLLLDLDHFKKVNDTWGHPIGDELLKLTAKTMEKTKRSSDILVRFGGEEFLLLMPHTAVEGAAAAAEKLRESVEKNSHPVTGVQTVSIGLAQRMRAESFRHWYKRADDALYNAKQNGRNRCHAAEYENEAILTSMIRLGWSHEWDSGNRLIDRQHQEMLEIADRLIEITLEGKNHTQMLKQLDVLLNHIVQHFEQEEKILSEIGYPEQTEHSSIHNDLISKAMNLKESFEKNDLRPSAFFSFIVDDVITGHMVSEDIKYFPYLSGKHTEDLSQ